MRGGLLCGVQKDLPLVGVQLQAQQAEVHEDRADEAPVQVVHIRPTRRPHGADGQQRHGEGKLQEARGYVLELGILRVMGGGVEGDVEEGCEQPELAQEEVVAWDMPGVLEEKEAACKDNELQECNALDVLLEVGALLWLVSAVNPSEEANAVYLRDVAQKEGSGHNLAA